MTRVLYIEDNDDDALLVQEGLARNARPALEVERADRLSAGLARLEVGGVDALLVDLHLPDSRGLATVDAIRQQAPDVPVVVLTGSVEDGLGQEAVRRGAAEFLCKQGMTLPALSRALWKAVWHRWVRQTPGQAPLPAAGTAALVPGRAFEQVAEGLLEAARAEGRAGAILFAAIDDFDELGESLGYSSAQHALEIVAERIAETVGTAGLVAHLTGPHFAILLDFPASPRAAASLSTRLIDTIAAPIELDGQDLVVTASIGISLFTRDGADLGTLLHRADVARRSVVREGGHDYQFYHRSRSVTAWERDRLERDLEKALDRQELRLRYQPWFEVTGQRVVGLEAVIDWEHPRFGRVGADEMMPAAIRAGLVVPIGEWMLRNVCRNLAAWRREYRLELFGAVPVFRRQLVRIDFIGRLCQILDQADIEPGALVLGVSEADLRLGSAIQDILRVLRSTGVHLAVDRFGSRLCRLADLRRWAFGSVKLDPQLLRGVPQDGDAAALASGIIALAQRLGLAVAVPGIQSAQQLAFLRSLGCTRVQGCYLGNAVPAEEVEGLLARSLASWGRSLLEEVTANPAAGTPGGDPILEQLRCACQTALDLPVDDPNGRDWLDRFCLLADSLARYLGRRCSVPASDRGGADLSPAALDVREERLGMIDELELVLIDARSMRGAMSEEIGTIRDRARGLMQRLGGVGRTDPRPSPGPTRIGPGNAE